MIILSATGDALISKDIVSNKSFEICELSNETLHGTKTVCYYFTTEEISRSMNNLGSVIHSNTGRLLV